MRYVDTSVLIAYLTRETGSDVAEAFMRSQGEPLAISSWTEVELLSAFGLKVRTGSGEETVIGVDPTAAQLFVDGEVFFYATDGTNGTELWRTDGTRRGTRMTRNINPGSGNANPQELTPFGDALFFRADDGAIGNELWRSNGTRRGTRLVEDINLGAGDSNPGFMERLGKLLIFRAIGTGGNEPWKLRP